MRRIVFVGLLAFAGLFGWTASGTAATLDDILAQLQSMQRDNQAIRRDNEAMRKELAALRGNESPPRPQAAAAQSAPSRTLPPSVSSAMAADFPVSRGYTKAVPVEGPYNWTGFYAGVNAGYASGTVESTYIRNSDIFPGTTDYRGFFGGGQIGGNYQIGQIVLGLEADLQYASLGGNLQVIPLVGAQTINTLEAFGTVRGRIGYAFDRFLPFVTAGVAIGRNKLEIPIEINGVESPPTVRETHVGWAAGAGLEYGIGDRWTLRAEYLHVDLGSEPYEQGIPQTIFTNQMKFDLGRAAVNYRF